jgi:rhamnogalacturonan endolyase
MRALILGLFLTLACGAETFVRIPPTAQLDEFEIATHPVTNLDYKQFLDGTGFAPPLHSGPDNYPVVFVNRYDVEAYLKWRAAKEGRVYRLPTVSEFEHAARAGVAGARYPWGNDPPEGKANYDPKGDRTFGQWKQHLKPVGSYAPNGYGLYDMAGNVWQMVDSYPDPAIARFKYRIVNPATELEGALAGGSWARAAYYLQTNVRGSASPGIRHPDIGFRLVREPADSTHFRRQPRRLAALPRGNGSVYLSWQLLPSDPPDAAFHVYRSRRRDQTGERLTQSPIRDSTNYLDRTTTGEQRYYYRVRPVNGPPSEWAGVNPNDPPTAVAAMYQPTVKQGGFLPIFGDLDGDGVLDAVLRLDNGLREMSRDPGVPVELEGFTSYGRSIWRRPLVWHDHCFGSANNVPVVVHDLDGDGKAEIAARLQEGKEVYLAVLDGMSGEVKRKTPWTRMATDFSKSSTRIHLSVAYLDGKTPALVTQTGLYENEIFVAYDRELNQLWEFKSFAETNGSGSHHIDIADVDGDGRDEVFDGTTVLNPDGTMRWSIYREHPDIVAIKRLLPDRPGRQVFYAVESSTHAGAYVVDAKDGKIIWKVNREDDPRWTHAHMGWAADIFAGSPGIEMLTNRDGHEAKDQVLFAATGKILLNPFPPGWYPVNWTGGPVRELMTRDGKRLGRFTGSGVEPLAGVSIHESTGSCPMVADLAGDYRDEVVCMGTAKDGSPAVFVYTNTEPVARRDVTRTASREYRLWMARNMGGGYPSYFEWEK